ncbi:MAG: FtsX-like permease family protein [Bacteroidota bacterium]
MMPSDHRPPKWADRFLEWFCHPDLLEEIQGDIYELFDLRLREKGPSLAARHFVWDVLRSFRWSTVKKVHFEFSTIMLKSNFKIAFRQLSRQKLFTAIKIGGFALGLAACMLIALFILDELSYDQHYTDQSQIYRVVAIHQHEGRLHKNIWFPAPFAKVLASDFPEIELAGRYNPGQLFGAGNNQLRRTDQVKVNFEEGFAFFDPALLRILEIPLVAGTWEDALREPQSMVIAQGKADQYFPDENPIGKTFILNNDPNRIYKVGGVMKPFPKNSHLHFDFLLTLAGQEFYPGEQNFWRANNYPTYIKVKEGTNLEVLESKLLSVVENYYVPSVIERGIPDELDFVRKQSFKLQPVGDIYLKSPDIEDLQAHGEVRFLWLFGAIALFILIIAGINFVNLSTARSANRGKEVGIRKVMGSLRQQLIAQFLTESVVLSGLAFLIGLQLVHLFLPYFNYLADKDLSIPWTAWWFIPLLLLMLLMVGVLAGLYPAFYLSSFEPQQAIKGSLSRGSKPSRLRNGLVVFQFTTSIVLLIGTFVIFQQLNYILNKEVGYDKEQVLMLKGADTIGDKLPTLKQELLQLPEVKHVAVSNYLPISGTIRNSNGFALAERQQEDALQYGQLWEVDHDYIKTMGMRMRAGRDFSLEMPTDSQAIIINQQMAKSLGLTAALGERMTIGQEGEPRSIIGVVEDFHFESLRQPIGGLCMVIGNSPSTVSVKLTTTEMSTVLPKITAVWEQFAPNQPIRYNFLDERFAIMYADVERIQYIFSSFALLAIIIACLGLFALSAFIAEQRSKEVSIRKILGASTLEILRLLTQNFLFLILLSFLLAVPIAWQMMRNWLADFAYPIELTWHVFFLAGILAIVVAIVTVGHQAYLAARNNPGEVLKS